MQMSNLSRRSIVAGAAALPALAVPAVASAAIADPDPIYAAIEVHQKAYEAWIKALTRFGDTEEDTPTARVYLDRLWATSEELAAEHRDAEATLFNTRQRQFRVCWHCSRTFAPMTI
jgi:hypothetical protein